VFDRLESGFLVKQVAQVEAAETFGTGQTHFTNVTRPVQASAPAGICDGFLGCVDGIRSAFGRKDQEHEQRHEMNRSEIERLRELVEQQQRTVNDLSQRLTFATEVNRQPHEIEYQPVDMSRNILNNIKNKSGQDFDDESNSGWTDEVPGKPSTDIKNWHNKVGTDQHSMVRLNPETGQVQFKRPSNKKEPMTFSTLPPPQSAKFLQGSGMG
jgi:hypothetical protein